MDRFDVAQGTAVGDCVWVEIYGGLGLVLDVGTWASESSPSANPIDHHTTSIHVFTSTSHVVVSGNRRVDEGPYAGFECLVLPLLIGHSSG